jgi:N-carbamoyl-L-amino-acid hydrolase
MSHSGKTIREGIRAIGGDPERLVEARRKPGDFVAFLELHIEQGGILESEKIDIGVVEGIVGINWWDVTITGFANHAGTTPMNARKDALVAASKLILEVHQIARTPGRQVATVGRIRAEPGAPNVIPGKVVMSLEIRDLSSNKIDQVFGAIERAAEHIASQTQTTIEFQAIDVTAVPAPTDPRLRKIIAEVAGNLGLTSKLMPSGAGHDAQDLAKIAPTGMIFVPSVGGISHSPKEFTQAKDMANGASVLLHTILRIDQGGL